MFYAISWFVVLSLLAIWSLAAWAFHAVTAWTISNAGVLAGGAEAGKALRLPEWLAAWLPPEVASALTAMVSAVTPAIEAALQWAPNLTGGLSVAVWLIWGVGSVLLVVLGMLLTALIAATRRRAPMPATAPAGLPTAPWT